MLVTVSDDESCTKTNHQLLFLLFVLLPDAAEKGQLCRSKMFCLHRHILKEDIAKQNIMYTLCGQGLH